MSTVYLETSALLTWLLGEPRSPEVVSRLNTARTVVTSVLTLLECERALVRIEAEERLRAGDCQKLKGMLAKASSEWTLMEVSREVRSRAAHAFPVEPLRTLDAIHLSTALAFMKVYPELLMLSYDRRVIENVEALGIALP